MVDLAPELTADSTSAYLPRSGNPVLQAAFDASRVQFPQKTRILQRDHQNSAADFRVIRNDLVQHEDLDFDWSWFDEHIEKLKLAFVHRIERDLIEDRIEAIELDESEPDAGAVEACIRIARSLASCIAFAPGLKRAAFTEEDAAVSLVLQSLSTGRRVNFRIPSVNGPVSIIRVDENHGTSESDAAIDDVRSLRENAEWVIQRA